MTKKVAKTQNKTIISIYAKTEKEEKTLKRDFFIQ